MIILNINVMVLEIKIYHLKNILIKLIHTWIYINMILVPSKNWVFFGGVRNILLEREINLKRSGGGEVDVEMEGLPLFYYFTVQSHLLSLSVCVCVSVSLSLSVLSLFSLCSLSVSLCVCVCVYMRACVCACVWGGSKVSFITFWIFSILSYQFKILIHVFIVIKPGIISTFLIHSGSLQKMLTALFNLVWNTQKS